MKKTKLFITILTATIAIVGVCTALPPQSRTQPADAAQEVQGNPAACVSPESFRGYDKYGVVICGFDHSQCQYPDRTTNPPNGCDNTDPCDPADAAKGGSGACTPAQASITPDLPVKPNQCGATK